MPKAKSKDRNKIIIRGARVNNLKNIDVEIPKGELVVITGLSGSGKSSLAFDVIFAEGNRRYLEGMSSYVRHFLDINAKPDVDKIENLSPTISIDQRSISRSPRSTVGTLTEIYDYLRVLFSKIGVPHCPSCRLPMLRKSNREILDEIFSLSENTQVAILAKIGTEGKNLKEVLKNISQFGYARVRLNGKIMALSEASLFPEEEKNPSVEIVIDRITIKHKNPDEERIMDSIETAFRLGRGFLVVSIDNQEDRFFNRDFVCPDCNFRISEITPKHFSFNNPEGACSNCAGLGSIREVDEDLIMPNKNLTLAEGAIIPLAKSGGRMGGHGNCINILKALGEKCGFSIHTPIKKLSSEQLRTILYGGKEKELDVFQRNGDGIERKSQIEFFGIIPIIKKKYEEVSSLAGRSEIEKYMLEKQCPKCLGNRLKNEYLTVLVNEKSINDVSRMNISNFVNFLEELERSNISSNQKKIIAPLVHEMILKARALENVGLEYLSLFRGADSISGGEAQRIRLSSQIGSELSGIVYVLDEPSIGLHSRDTQKLIKTMELLKDTGNSLIVVEHDKDIIEKADWIVDMGPGAGEEGGRVIFEGNIAKLTNSKTSTARYLSGRERISQRKKTREASVKFMEIIGAREHNLKNIDVRVPLERFVAIAGVSGSGKSSLVSDILAKALAKHFFKAKSEPGRHKKIKGLNYIDKVISIDQAPIGRTPRSNAATYTGVFSVVRELFAQTQEAKNAQFDASHFSFNMKGGRCDDCQGDGTKKIEMHLMPDMYVKCETCNGTRYNQKTLDIEYQGVNISQVLDMSVSYALRFFSKSPLIAEKLRTLEEVGLGYLKLGQSATNLSGGEAQRIKLATELSRRSTGKTLYILDEPTIGLHFEDVKNLLKVLDALVDKGNSVIVVEHNLDIIRNSDWIIDLGPEGGEKGGEIVYEGSPAGIKKCKRSWTGKYL